jgi:hypothetical protein
MTNWHELTGFQRDLLGQDARPSHGPCVKHRCCSCHRIFDSVIHGTDCPHCSAASMCSSENREECQ